MNRLRFSFARVVRQLANPLERVTQKDVIWHAAQDTSQVTDRELELFATFLTTDLIAIAINLNIDHDYT